MPERDREDVRRTLGEDPAAFRGLVERHQDRLFDLALRMTRDKAEAEDAVQEAFLKMYRGLRRFDAGRPFGAWAYAVTLNVVRSRMRWRALRRFLRLEDAWDAAETAPSGREEAAERLDDAIGRLPGPMREAVVLHYIHDMPLERVAQATGAGLSAVKVRLFRARKRLAVLLEEASHENV